MDKITKVKKAVLISVFVVSLIIFLVFAILVSKSTDLKMDRFNSWIAKNRTNSWTNFFETVTYLGNFYVLLIVSVMALLLLKNKRYGCMILVSLIFVSVINVLVKHIVCRPRPPYMISNESGYSFPSAHAMMSLAVYTVITYYLVKGFKSKLFKSLSILICTIIVLLVSFSRVYLGVHYVSDVIAGIFFSLALLNLELFIIDFIKKQAKKKQSRMSRSK